MTTTKSAEALPELLDPLILTVLEGELRVWTQAQVHAAILADRTARVATVMSISSVVGSVGEDVKFNAFIGRLNNDAFDDYDEFMKEFIAHIDSLLAARPSAAVSVPEELIKNLRDPSGVVSHASVRGDMNQAANLLERLSAASPLPKAAKAEPVLFQFRTRPEWDERISWSNWQDCSAESFADYERMPQLHNWLYEVRALYTSPPQAEPVSTARAVCDVTGCDGKGNLYNSRGHHYGACHSTAHTPPAIPCARYERKGWSKFASVHEQALDAEVTALKTELLAVRYANKTPLMPDMSARDAALPTDGEVYDELLRQQGSWPNYSVGVVMRAVRALAATMPSAAPK